MRRLLQTENALLVVVGIVLWMIAVALTQYLTNEVVEEVRQELVGHDSLGAHPGMRERANAMDRHHHWQDSLIFDLQKRLEQLDGRRP